MAEVEGSSASAGLADASQRDILADGILGLLKPAVEEMDGRVAGVRESQQELRSYIDTLAEGERDTSR